MPTSSLRGQAGRSRAVPLAAAAFALVTLFGCGTAPLERRDTTLQLAAMAQWQSTLIPAGRFRLLTLHPAPVRASELAVFIEGDGYAWADLRTPSADPTPHNPVALRLALAESRRPGGRTSAYLARPCQFDPAGTPKNCSTDDWTQARFSGEAVAAMNMAVSQLKHMFSAERLVLVGYSGGGAVAALVAARRTDVTLLVTVAGVLDHDAWTRAQGVSPLTGSMNPAGQWQALTKTRQVHLVGGRDTQTGRAAVQPFVDRFNPGQKPVVIDVPDFSHACCWVENWPRLSPK